MKPYWEDESVRLYHGDMREVIQDFTDEHWADAVVTDPPYGETSLAWDRWPDGWPLICTWHTTSMWVFGSMRMFTERWADFKGWKLSQDIVWEKHNGSGLAADRFKRVHEHALHFYTGAWADVYHETPRTGARRAVKVGRRGASAKATHGERGASPDIRDGSTLVRSVLRGRSLNGRSLHPTQKPTGVLTPLIEYACPPGGLVLDPFAGSGSTAVAAVLSGRRAVLIEANERHCEVAAKRLAQGVLPFAAAEPGGAQ